MESDYDDVIAPSEFFGTDEKGDAAFGEHGFGAEERNPIYQGEYHEYEGGEWVNMKTSPTRLDARTQMLWNAQVLTRFRVWGSGFRVAGLGPRCFGMRRC